VSNLFSDSLLRQLRNDISFSTTVRAIELATQAKKQTAGIRLSAVQGKPVGGESAYEFGSLFPLSDQLQSDRFHDGCTNVQLCGRGLLFGAVAHGGNVVTNHHGTNPPKTGDYRRPFLYAPTPKAPLAYRHSK